MSRKARRGSGGGGPEKKDSPLPIGKGPGDGTQYSNGRTAAAGAVAREGEGLMALKDHDKMVELVAESCRVMGELEVTKEALGHVSWRIPGTETMLIKGKGPGEVG